MAEAEGHCLPAGKHVLLLKAPKEDEEDRFVDALAQVGYRPVLVPVLSFKFVNQQELASALQNADDLSGVIFTSPRSVQAVTQAVSLLKDSGGTFDPTFIRCFVVGEATAAAATAAGFSPEGQESGNAESLVNIILDEVDKAESKRLLFPCAQMRRDTIMQELTSKDVRVQEIIAYETCASESLKQDITDALSKEGTPECVVFFSPSGVQFTESIMDEGILPLQQMKVYALGPTTQKAILAKGYHLNGVAAKPDPASLIQLLQQDAERS